MISIARRQFTRGNFSAVAVFKHLNRLRERARRIVDADRKLLRDFLVQAIWPFSGLDRLGHHFVRAIGRWQR